MTRKSRREIERVLDDVEQDQVDYREMLEYLELVGERGRDAPAPCEHFGEDPEWGGWVGVLPESPPEDLPLGISAEELAPVEHFGLRYMGPGVRRGILERVLTSERSGGAG